MLIDTHIHLFAADHTRFPFHPKAPYLPDKATPVEQFLQDLTAAGLDAAVQVHPEPYQDDHS